MWPPNGYRLHLSNSPPCARHSFKTQLLQDTASRSRRRFHARFALSFRPLKTEGAGNAGCALHPRPPVQQKSTGVSNQGYTATAGIPCTMVLRLIRALPGDHAWLPPSPVRRWKRLHDLDACIGAPGPHDFAVRKAARTSAHSPRPPHPALYVRDDRETPLVRRRDGIAIFLFLPGCQGKFGNSEI
jgi:hypothetical protein